MSEQPRVKREQPVRTAPIRDASMMFRPVGVSTAADGARPESVDRSTDGDSAVERGVDTAYRVLEDYLRRGRQAARRRGSAGNPAAPWTRGATEGGLPRDVQDLAWKTVRFWSDVAALWVDYLGPLVPGAPGADPGADGDAVPTDPEPPARAWEGRAAGAHGPVAEAVTATPAAAHSAAAQSLGRVAVAVEVRSVRPVEVTVDLPPGAAGTSLAVQDLRPLGPGSAVLTGVTLETDPDGRRVTVRVSVPPGVPAGTYLGAVFDTARGEPHGALRVVIRD